MRSNVAFLRSLEHPLGIAGDRLHEWALPLAAWRAPHGLEGGEVQVVHLKFVRR